MIVRLTVTQDLHLRRAVMDDPDVLEAIEMDRRIEGKIDIIAPYAAWVFAREALMDRAFGSRGYRRKGVPMSLQSALKSVVQAINFTDRHPALRDSGVLGHHPLIIPAWRIEPDRLGRIYSPYPQLDREFVVLKPTWHTGHGRSYTTTWGPEGVGSAGWLAEEAVHQRLWRPGLALVG